ncbi:MAG: sporulation protein [Syntrophomonadaceae bacterium]|nr:sporulation protein [Syntrophomonadaceae bacterium]
MSLNQNISAILEQMADFFKSDTVVGKPIKVGDITLIPLITVSFGIGNGSGVTPKDKKGHWSTSGTASGGKISPSAIVVIKNNEVSVLPLAGKGALDKINEMLPIIVGHLGGNGTNSEPSPS